MGGKREQKERGRKNGRTTKNSKNSTSPDDANSLLAEDHTICDSESTFNESAGFADDDHDESTDIDKILNGLDLASSIPTEKRSSKRREEILIILFKCISCYAVGEAAVSVIESHLESVILPGCLAFCLVNKSSKSNEQYAACRCLEACCIILGNNQDDYTDSLSSPLKKIIQSTGVTPQVRSAALRTLSMSYYINSTDLSACYELIAFCQTVSNVRFRGQDCPEILRLTALECWGLLCGTIPEEDLVGGDDCLAITMLPMLKDVLTDAKTSITFKAAAGGCLALIHETRLGFESSWDGSSSEVIMDELKQIVLDLSLTSGHYISKKEKKEQRYIFREYATTLIDDESTTEIVSLRGHNDVILTSWKDILALNFIRHCLQGGFQAQLMSNKTLHEVFGMDTSEFSESSGAATQLEKKMTQSKTSEASKYRDRDMDKKRRSRMNAKNHFISADGEDI